jgi:PTH1 family peptidyl-tRNA hydrolase
VNRTGDAVISLLKKYPRPGDTPGHTDFLFVCDDVNLPFGKMRLRESGSAGGHHGLESVVQAFGSEEFARLRIGVGIENMPNDLTGFVLEKFSELEQKEMEGLLEKAALVCESWITDGLQAARNKLSQLQS